jgi:hypothetical protein
MATHYLTDVDFTLNSVDLSSDVASITLTTSRAVDSDTAMGDTSMSYIAGGVKSWSLSVTFNQDFAASDVDATLAAIEAGDAAVPIIILPTSAGVGATNPKWTGNVILASYDPITGSHGAVHTVTAELTGTGNLTRAEA